MCVRVCVHARAYARMYKVDGGWVVRKPTRQILSREPGVCFCPAGECWAHLYFKGSEKPFIDILDLPNCAWPGTVCSFVPLPPSLSLLPSLSQLLL